MEAPGGVSPQEILHSESKVEKNMGKILENHQAKWVGDWMILYISVRFFPMKTSINYSMFSIL